MQFVNHRCFKKILPHVWEAPSYSLPFITIFATLATMHNQIDVVERELHKVLVVRNLADNSTINLSVGNDPHVLELDPCPVVPIDIALRPILDVVYDIGSMDSPRVRLHAPKVCRKPYLHGSDCLFRRARVCTVCNPNIHLTRARVSHGLRWPPAVNCGKSNTGRLLTIGLSSSG